MCIIIVGNSLIFIIGTFHRCGITAGKTGHAVGRCAVYVGVLADALAGVIAFPHCDGLESEAIRFQSLDNERVPVGVGVAFDQQFLQRLGTFCTNRPLSACESAAGEPNFLIAGGEGVHKQPHAFCAFKYGIPAYIKLCVCDGADFDTCPGTLDGSTNDVERSTP